MAMATASAIKIALQVTDGPAFARCDHTVTGRAALIVMQAYGFALTNIVKAAFVTVFAAAVGRVLS
jgi:hypothetical protein